MRHPAEKRTQIWLCLPWTLLFGWISFEFKGDASEIVTEGDDLNFAIGNCHTENNPVASVDSSLSSGWKHLHFGQDLLADGSTYCVDRFVNHLAEPQLERHAAEDVSVDLGDAPEPHK